MYDGVKAMIDKEKELRPKAGAAPQQPVVAPQQPVVAPQQPVAGAKPEESKETVCGPQLKKPEDIVGFPKFPAGTKSLLMKHLTPEIWAKYQNSKDKHGFSFKAAILSGC